MQTINLCDVIDRIPVSSLSGFTEKYDRVYVGSYFCNNYFFAISPRYYSRIFPDKKLTLVLPVVPESKNKLLWKYVDEAYRCRNVDEVVVNSLGQLQRIKRYKRLNVVIGRLLTRTLRDGRYDCEKSAAPTLDSFNEITGKHPVSGIEYDYFGQTLPTGPSVRVHTPYYYQTTGAVCEVGALNKAPDRKFRCFAGCNGECNRHHEEYDADPRYYKLGKTVFGRCPEPWQGENAIYFPFDEVTA